jgi:hypothetical protein
MPTLYRLGGDRITLIAWFKDPAGNILSVLEVAQVMWRDFFLPIFKVFPSRN